MNPPNLDDKEIVSPFCFFDKNASLSYHFLKESLNRLERNTIAQSCFGARDFLLKFHDTIRHSSRNTIVFLAADRTRVEELKQGLRLYLAWESICIDSMALNLDPFQNKQAQTQRDSAKKTVELRVPQTYHGLLVPEQTDARQSAQSVQLTEVRLQPQTQATPLAPDASRKLRNEELFVTQYAGILLHGDRDKIPLWRGNHVTVKELADFFASYPYLKRLKSTEVLLSAIADGLSNPAWQTSTFAYADGYDPEKQRYLNLRAGQSIQVILDGQSLSIGSDSLDSSAVVRARRGP